MRALIFFLVCGPLSAIAGIKADSFHWQQKVRADLVEELCGDKNGHALSCFEISAAKCRSAANKHFAFCAKSAKIPKKIEPLGEGLKIAYFIGACTGSKMDKEFYMLKKPDPKCNQADKWQ